MNVVRLVNLCVECAKEFRKGEMETVSQQGSVEVHEVFLMPHVSEAAPELEMVDVWFIMVGVDKTKAEAHRDEFVAILNEWPDFERLKSGLSYIEIGGVIGSQDVALILMGIGKVLGFWDVVSPQMLMGKASVEKLNELAGAGFVMATGYLPKQERKKA